MYLLLTQLIEQNGDLKVVNIDICIIDIKLTLYIYK